MATVRVATCDAEVAGCPSGGMYPSTSTSRLRPGSYSSECPLRAPGLDGSWRRLAGSPACRGGFGRPRLEASAIETLSRAIACMGGRPCQQSTGASGGREEYFERPASSQEYGLQCREFGTRHARVGPAEIATVAWSSSPSAAVVDALVHAETAASWNQIANVVVQTSTFKKPWALQPTIEVLPS